MFSDWQQVPLTALLSDIAISGAFADQQISGNETPGEVVDKIKKATLGSDRRLLQQELSFYHGMAEAIEADYQACGFHPAFAADVRSGQVFDPSVLSVREAIEARVGSIWGKMMHDTPTGICNMRGELETGYHRLMDHGVDAGVDLGGTVIHDNRLVETVVCIHHMVARVGSMLQRGGYDITSIQI